MKESVDRLADFELENGVLLEVKVRRDELGTPVISELRFFSQNRTPLPVGGITAKTLKEVNFEQILLHHFQMDSSIELSTKDRARLLKYLKTGMEFSGRTGFPKHFYAALAYFYVETYERFPKEPTAKLVEILDIPKRTLINRLAVARKLELLTQQSVDRPTGKAGGSLTSEAWDLIQGYLSD
jgi:hypothetical protein